MKPAIRIDGLSKLYHIGVLQRKQNRNLRELFMDGLTAPWRRLRHYSRRSVAAPTAESLDATASSADTIWALKDVSFEVQPGEVLGIIGRNGAGKSTLLKILSRVVEPTAGRVELRGRLGSLLEVGTGFHPELSGRENIYLNGAILGMGRREIDEKFDEIVAFSEIEKFIDTPVKRYSSGMYVRLAFSVAAHLDTEILLVDEVLSVGDTAFQKKCLKKIQNANRAGRTVILVSHDLGSVRSLCKTAIHLDQGRFIGKGTAESQIARYLASMTVDVGKPIGERRDREGNGRACFTSLQFVDGDDNTVQHSFSGADLKIVLGYRSDLQGVDVDMLALSFWTETGTLIFHVDNTFRMQSLLPLRSDGTYACLFPRLPLPAGKYYINVLLAARGEICDHVVSAAALEVLPGDYYGSGKLTSANDGLVFVDHEWN